MTNEEFDIVENVRNIDRYKKFTYLHESIRFNKCFKNQNFDLVQVHDINPIGDVGEVLGFVGTFKWENNKIISLDGDSYEPDMKIYGYNKFADKKVDILVMDW